MEKQHDEFNNVERVIALALLLKKSEQEQRELCQKFSQLDEKSLVTLLRLVRSNAVETLFYQNLLELEPESKAGTGLKQYLITALEGEVSKLRLQGLERARRAATFFDAMNEAEVPYLKRKGSLLGEALYGDVAYKKMNDVDVLIKPANKIRVQSMLGDLGFSCVSPVPENNFFYRSVMGHESPYWAPDDLSCFISLQWAAVPPLAPFQSNTEDYWSEESNKNTHLSWELAFLDIIVDMDFLKVGLRELMDLINLARVEGFDWQKVQSLAESWRVHDLLIRSCVLMDTVLPGFIPASFLEPSGIHNPLLREDTVLRSKDLQTLMAGRTAYASDFEKMLFALVKATSFSDKKQKLKEMKEFFWDAESSQFEKVMMTSLSPGFRPKANFARKMAYTLHLKYGAKGMAIYSVGVTGLLAKQLLSRRKIDAQDDALAAKLMSLE